MRILVVEDDPSLHKIISRRLREEGYAVDDCYNGEEALSYLLAAEYDCVILDWMLPVRDGITVLSEARQRGVAAPVLMLTAKDAISDRVQGLDAGADDYLTKPFAYDELSARVRALLRRKAKEKQTMLTAGDLVMDLAAHRVTRGEKEITIHNRIPEEITLFADQSLFTNLLMNLIGNAIKYGKEGGHIWLDAAAGSAGVTLTIKDDGIGISEEDAAHVFERFYRADRARDRSGSGLGLAIVKWIVELHGGDIRVESELNQGSAFIVNMPAQEAL